MNYNRAIVFYCAGCGALTSGFLATPSIIADSALEIAEHLLYGDRMEVMDTSTDTIVLQQCTCITKTRSLFLPPEPSFSRRSPAPWWFNSDSGHVYDVKGRPVATLALYNNQLDFYKSNGPLIAAAPELLETVVSLAEALRNCDRSLCSIDPSNMIKRSVIESVKLMYAAQELVSRVSSTQRSP